MKRRAIEALKLCAVIVVGTVLTFLGIAVSSHPAPAHLTQCEEAASAYFTPHSEGWDRWAARCDAGGENSHTTLP